MKSFKHIFVFCLLWTTFEVCNAKSYNFTPIESSHYYDNDSYSYNDYESYHQNNRKYRRHSDRYEDHFYGGSKTFVFDPKVLRWFAYSNGALVNSGRASGGKFYCPDIRRPCKTPVGVFRVGHKGGPDCKSSKYPVGRGNAPMPWCMFFHGGYAIHGSWAVPNHNASHGCIRVPPSDARWLNQYFMRSGTTVIVKGYH